jgi:hypothetical protein
MAQNQSEFCSDLLEQIYPGLIALWDYVPVPGRGTISPVGGRDSEGVALELIRFNNELSKFLEK